MRVSHLRLAKPIGGLYLARADVARFLRSIVTAPPCESALSVRAGPPGWRPR